MMLATTSSTRPARPWRSPIQRVESPAQGDGDLFGRRMLEFAYAVDTITHMCEFGYRQINRRTFLRARRTGQRGWLREVTLWYYDVDPFDPAAQGVMRYAEGTGVTMRLAYERALRNLRSVRGYGSERKALAWGEQQAESKRLSLKGVMF